MSDSTPKSWPELGAELFDQLTGRQAEITYYLDNMEVSIPSRTTESGVGAPDSAVWKFNGALRVSSRTLDQK